MAALLALLSAAAYGVGDFFGGLSGAACRRPRSCCARLAAGLLELLAVVPLVGGAAAQVTWPSGPQVGWPALGVLAFYRAMASGSMSLVAPVTAVTAAIVPVGYGLATGERPSFVSLVGIPLALLAVALLSREGGAAAPSRACRSSSCSPRSGPAPASGSTSWRSA